MRTGPCPRNTLPCFTHRPRCTTRHVPALEPQVPTCLLRPLRPRVARRFGARLLPNQMFGICSLENLELGSNALTTLSDEVSRLTALRALKLDSNKLRVLPEGALQHQLPSRVRVACRTCACLPMCVWLRARVHECARACLPPPAHPPSAPSSRR